MKPIFNPGLGFGRIIEDDPRDDNWPLSDLLPESVQRSAAPERMWWSDGWHGNQGSTPHCVAFAFAHWLADGPHPISLFPARRPGVDTTELYCEAQKRDDRTGDCDDPQYRGTTLRSGAKVLQAWGFISEYRWTRNLDQVIDWLSNHGTIIAGTWWYESMFNPDADGVVTIGGRRAASHAYLLNGVDHEAKMVRFKNSWGTRWSRNGHAFMSFDTLERLIAERGEMCAPIPQLGAS